MRGVGYTNRWIKFGGKRGVVALHLFNDGNRMLCVGPVALHHFTRRFRCWLLPRRSHITGSIMWLRLCLGRRGT